MVVVVVSFTASINLPQKEPSSLLLSMSPADTAALQNDPIRSSAHYLQRGIDHQKQGRLLEAVAAFQRASVIDPSNGEAFLNVGKVYAAMGYIDDAESTLRDILSRPSLSQWHRGAQLSLTNVLLDGKGQKVDALELYRASFDEGRSSPWTVVAGIVADSMGDHEAARQFYQAAEMDETTALHLTTSLARGEDGLTNNSTPHRTTTAEEMRACMSSHVASSCDYLLATSVGGDPSSHFFTYDMLQLAFRHCSPDLAENGLILEFGVYHGKTIRMIASEFPNDPVHGFDTFSGIPADWHSTRKGSYSTQSALPPAPDNVQYHVGLFSETLPDFLERHPEQPVRFMNVDCDLYSSTKDIFDAVHGRIVPGTVIVFDEYVMNPHWREDEYRAFQEAVKEYGWKYEYLGISLVSQQAVVKII